MQDEHGHDLEKWMNRVPAPGETCVFSDRLHWKRDALLFDRVYARVDRSSSRVPDIPIKVSFGVEKLDEELGAQQQAVALGFGMGLSTVGMDENGLQQFRKSFEDAQITNQVDEERGLTRMYWNAGIMASWSFGERGLYRRFSEGECVAYQGALQNLPVVLGDGVSWDEILEFRHDKEATRKYRDLRVWLSEGVKATSAEHAADIIGQKIENYRWAINKHGLKTKLGAVTQLFQWKESSLAVAAGGAIGAIVGPLYGAIAGGLVALGQVGIYIGQQSIDRKEVLRGADREVAILYEAQEKFGAQGNDGSDTRKR
jgi:hypothetical protein